MNCKEACDMILKGEGSAALEQHLAQCTDCRILKEEFRRISEAAGKPLAEVPEQLDRAILSFAAEQAPRRVAGPTLLFRMPLLRAAAAVAVLAACAVLTFSAMTGTAKRPAAAVSAVSTGAAESAQSDGMNYLYASAELDAELLALSVELDQTESDMQLVASASTPAWYGAGGYPEF